MSAPNASMNTTSSSGASAASAAEEEKEVEQLAALGLALTRSLRHAIRATAEHLHAGPQPLPSSCPAVSAIAAQGSRKRKADEEGAFKVKEEPLDTLPQPAAPALDSEGFIGRVKRDLDRVTKGYEELERLGSRGLRKPWRPLLSENAQLLLSSGPLGTEEGGALEALTERTYGFVSRDQQLAHLATLFLRGAAKQQRKTPPLSPVDPKQLQDWLLKMEEQLKLQYGPCVQLSLLEASTIQAKLLVKVVDGPRQSLSPVFHLAVFLRAGLIEWVTVKGPDETFEDEEGRLDFSQPSEYEVFRRLSGELKAFVLQAGWQQVGTGIPSLRPLFSFIQRSVRYRAIFTEKCKACDRHLNNFLPPYVMSPSGPTVAWYHDACRP